ncbi:protein FAM13A [Amia ocellicauda]|uniref:protein FAM13A n=1 Tax=Amia ocellicauda TaxID=2972642 RepID=UPI003464CB2A
MGASFSCVCGSKSTVKVVDSAHLTGNRVFAVPLGSIADAQLSPEGLPLVFITMVEYLEKHGLQEEGLFRVSGSMARVRLIKTKLDCGAPVDLDMEGGVSVVASVFKLFLRELPVALIPDHLGLVNTFKASTDEAELSSCLQAELDSLPAEHLRLLSSLVQFLARVASYCKSNKMTEQNLGIVFGPCIFHIPVGPTMQEDQLVCNIIVQYLLRNSFLLGIDSADTPPPAMPPTDSAPEDSVPVPTPHSDVPLSVPESSNLTDTPDLSTAPCLRLDSGLQARAA